MVIYTVKSCCLILQQTREMMRCVNPRSEASHLWLGWGVRLVGVQVWWHHLNKGPLRNFAQSCLDIQVCSAGYGRSGCPEENIKVGGGRRKKCQASIRFIPTTLSQYDASGLLGMLETGLANSLLGRSSGNLTSKPAEAEAGAGQRVSSRCWLDAELWGPWGPAHVAMLVVGWTGELHADQQCFLWLSVCSQGHHVWKMSAFISYPSMTVPNWKCQCPLKGLLGIKLGIKVRTLWNIHNEQPALLTGNRNRPSSHGCESWVSLNRGGRGRRPGPRGGWHWSVPFGAATWLSWLPSSIFFWGGGGLLPPLSVETESQSWMEDGLGAALPRAPPHGKAGVALETVARALHHPPLWRGEALAAPAPGLPGTCCTWWLCNPLVMWPQRAGATSVPKVPGSLSRPGSQRTLPPSGAPTSA